MKRQKSRQQKIKFLQDLKAGRASLKDVVKPITAMIVIHDGKVFGHQIKDGTQEVIPEMELDAFKAIHGRL